MKVVKKQNKLILFKRVEYIFIDPDNIILVERSNKDTIIKTKDGEFHSRDTLIYIQEQLPSNFIRVHRSFIINKNKVQKAMKYSVNIFLVTLEGGLEAFLHKKYLEKIIS
ncbi:LytTR family transcriptional regulator [Bacillus cereus]|nr:LytTR family transcriptional regulator [Bacillus cereus]